MRSSLGSDEDQGAKVWEASQPARAGGVLAAPGFDAGRLLAAAGGAQVLTGDARGAAEYPELELSRTIMIPVTAAFGGLAMFIAIFRRGRHARPVDPAARARDRAPAGGG